MRRRNNGKPLRDAMQAEGLTVNRLAELTRTTDPSGFGVSKSVIGHMRSTGTSGRETFTTRSCHLVAWALGKPVEHLFSDT